MNGNISKSRLSTAFGRLIQRTLGGWSVDGHLPELDKYVMAVAHHTSNWDFVVALSAKLVLGLKLRFFGKHTLFVGPLGWFMRILGGIPIERSQPHKHVTEAVTAIGQREHFVLAITPEGTRSKVKEWKSGFYYIAHAAEVPIVPVALDFANKKIVIGKPQVTTGNKEEDIKKLHRFFLPYKPKYPELACHGAFEGLSPDRM